MKEKEAIVMRIREEVEVEVGHSFHWRRKLMKEEKEKVMMMMR